jgi:hypothetical protein
MPEKKTTQIPDTAKAVCKLRTWQNVRKMAARNSLPATATVSLLAQKAEACRLTQLVCG